MRIGYLVPEFPGQTHAFFWREVECLRNSGMDVVLLSTRRPDTSACRHEFAARARSETLYLFPPNWPAALTHSIAGPGRVAKAIGYVLQLAESGIVSRLRLLGLIPVAAALVRMAKKIGIEHVHIHSCANSAHMGALSRILGGPSYSLTLHGDLPVYGRDHCAKMAGASFVATVTRALQRSVRDLTGLPLARVPVIWMGVDTEKIAPVPRVRLPGRPLQVITVARLNAAKGHVHMLAVQRRLMDRGISVAYTIAGEGPNRATLEAEIARLDLKEHVSLVGTIGETAVGHLLADSDVFVLPSCGLGEAAPVSVMEAMSSGLPVICSIIGGTPDMITDGVDGLLVPQKSEAELERALERLAVDPDLRQRLSRGARARACLEFDRVKLAERLRLRVMEAVGVGSDMLTPHVRE